MGQPRRARIAIDMDDVMAETLGKLIRLYNAEHFTRVAAEELNGVELRAFVPAHRRARIDAYLHAPGMFRDVGVKPGSQDVVRALMDKYEVFVATAAMEYPQSFAAKFAWLREHFSFIPWTHIVFCGDKSVLAVDYLIDDWPAHFQRFGGEGILFDAPHNVGVEGYRRVGSWDDVRTMFL